MVCIFDHASPKISAKEIHDWIDTVLQVSKKHVQMIQIDGACRRVYLKVTNQEEMFHILDKSKGSAEYRHTMGELSHVKIEIAGLGAHRVRIANLLPELPNAPVRVALVP
jgi:hypothetical protein